MKLNLNNNKIIKKLYKNKKIMKIINKIKLIHFK
jgi:hypothetical protein